MKLKSGKSVPFILAIMGLAVAGTACAQDAPFSLYDGHRLANVIYASKPREKAPMLVADMLARDLTALTGVSPTVASDLSGCQTVCVVIGEIDSPLVRKLTQAAHIDTRALKGAWEQYGRTTIKTPQGQSILLIYGSDRRGMIYGVVDLSREMGISAWEWWADVTPRRVDHIAVKSDAYLSKAPSVTYRGIFLNDEDWGLKPWAAKTFEPETGNIGPKTYARIYELMWRLKANTLWPAMHNITTPFYKIAENPKLADDYAIVVGTSHAEILMRNNFGEWDEKKDGDFNFFTNPDRMAAYWKARVEAVKGYDNLYTVGLRGVHDSAMEGAKTVDQAREALGGALKVQRNILSQAFKKPADQIPQTMTLYKEVLDTYQSGLVVPDDITLLWTDDNYGYIRELSTPEEQARKGGTGVYYHISYWGQPHDYLWLGTTHPALIREEMGKAYALNSRKEWIVNVGDIKPAEFLSQYFLDLAFDAKGFDKSPRDALKDWTRSQFGGDHADEITQVMMDYYDLAFLRRPEFMGWNGVEPVTRTQTDGFVGADGYEAQDRLAAYQNLKARAEAIADTLPEDRRSAYFELVLYPVRSAANLNARILSLDLAALYARTGRAAANSYVARAEAAQAQIDTDTAAYNGLEKGKWNGMMDSQPRKLPVFIPPAWPHYEASPQTGCDLAFAGGAVINAHDFPHVTFTRGVPDSRVVELYTYEARDVAFKVAQISGVTPSLTQGVLNADSAYQARIRLDWDGQGAAGKVSITCGTQTFSVPVDVLDPAPQTVHANEDNQSVMIPAALVTNTDWRRIEGLGFTGAAIESRLDLPSRADSDAVTPLSYQFFNRSTGDAKLEIIALPTHPLTPRSKLRVAVSVDGAAPVVVDFKTVGRSDVWKRNVLSNTARGSVPLKLDKGVHDLKVYALDPGVILDRFEISFDGAPPHYGVR